MLRQALDEAERTQLLQNLSRPQTPDTASGYGTASQTTAHEVYEDEEDEGSGSIEDDLSDDDDWSHSNSEHQQHPPSMARKAWDVVKNVFSLVANVENLWDSPVINANASIASGSQQGINSSAQASYRRRSYMIVLFWFLVLAGSYASERSTFKLLVDRAGPFRLFSVEMVTAAHATMLGLWMILSNLYHSKHREYDSSTSRIPLGVPLADVGYMALLDTFHLLLVFLTGRNVSPTLTVILVQFTLPLSAFLTQFVHSDGKCSCHSGRTGSGNGGDNDDEENAANEEERRFGSHHSDPAVSGEEADIVVEGTPLPGWGGLSAEHLWGSVILTVAVVLALLPSFYSIIDPSFFAYADPIPIQTAYNSLLYVSSCFPAAASQLYKEHVFLQNKQPVNASYLNFLLSLFQFILASVMTPLVFGLQGLGAGDDWTTLYPSSQFSNNFLSGLKCFLGLLPEDSAQNDFPEAATCDLSLLLVLGHAFSIIAVGCAVDKIINAGATKAMYRGISAGIIVAVLIMYNYDMHIPEFNYGPGIDLLNLISLILLVVGAEVYHRVSLSDSVFTTVYPTVDSLYEDE